MGLLQRVENGRMLSVFLPLALLLLSLPASHFCAFVFPQKWSFFIANLIVSLLLKSFRMEEILIFLTSLGDFKAKFWGPRSGTFSPSLPSAFRLHLDRKP